MMETPWRYRKTSDPTAESNWSGQWEFTAEWQWSKPTRRKSRLSEAFTSLRGVARRWWKSAVTTTTSVASRHLSTTVPIATLNGDEQIKLWKATFQNKKFLKRKSFVWQKMLKVKWQSIDQIKLGKKTFWKVKSCEFVARWKKNVLENNFLLRSDYSFDYIACYLKKCQKSWPSVTVNNWNRPRHTWTCSSVIFAFKSSIDLFMEKLLLWKYSGSVTAKVNYKVLLESAIWMRSLCWGFPIFSYYRTLRDKVRK